MKVFATEIQTCWDTSMLAFWFRGIFFFIDDLHTWERKKKNHTKPHHHLLCLTSSVLPPQSHKAVWIHIKLPRTGQAFYITIFANTKLSYYLCKNVTQLNSNCALYKHIWRERTPQQKSLLRRYKSQNVTKRIHTGQSSVNVYTCEARVPS